MMSLKTANKKDSINNLDKKTSQPSQQEFHKKVA